MDFYSFPSKLLILRKAKCWVFGIFGIVCKRDSSTVQARQIFFVAECSFFIRLFGRESRDLIQLNDAGSQGFLPIA
jgi:hypothetical protein